MVKLKGLDQVLLRQHVKEGMGHWVPWAYLVSTGVWKINQKVHILIGI